MSLDKTNWRLVVLAQLLLTLECVNLVKLSVAFGWTNQGVLGTVAALTLGAFLVGSIVALSFDLDAPLKKRLEVVVTALFVFQTLLVSVVSYLNSRTLMPTSDIAELFYASEALTQRVFAIAEGASTNIAAFAFWGILGSQWRKEVERRQSTDESRRERLHGLADVRDGAVKGASNAGQGV